MQSKFYQRRWFILVGFFTTALLGTLALTVGIAMKNGMRDAMGETRTEQAIYPIVMGCIMLLFAVASLAQFIKRRFPVIEVAPDALIFRVVGAAAPRIPLPGILGAFVSIFLPQTYLPVVRIVEWKYYIRAEVRGMPMNQFVRIHLRGDSPIELGQIYFQDNVEHVAKVLNAYANA